MTELPAAHVENSPEKIALDLLKSMASHEQKTIRLTIQIGGEPATGDRKWLLDTYAECIEAVKGTRAWQSH